MFADASIPELLCRQCKIPFEAYGRDGAKQLFGGREDDEASGVGAKGIGVIL